MVWIIFDVNRKPSLFRNNFIISNGIISYWWCGASIKPSYKMLYERWTFFSHPSRKKKNKFNFSVVNIYNTLQKQRKKNCETPKTCSTWCSSFLYIWQSTRRWRILFFSKGFCPIPFSTCLFNFFFLVYFGEFASFLLFSSVNEKLETLYLPAYNSYNDKCIIWWR